MATTKNRVSGRKKNLPFFTQQEKTKKRKKKKGKKETNTQRQDSWPEIT
jgi:hypothetical protein